MSTITDFTAMQKEFMGQLEEEKQLNAAIESLATVKP